MRRKKPRGRHAKPRFAPSAVDARLAFEGLRAAAEIAAAEPPEPLDTESVLRFREKLQAASRASQPRFDVPDLLLRDLVKAGCDELDLIRHLAAAGAVYALVNRIQRDENLAQRELYGVSRRALDRLPRRCGLWR
jgi:hypothetical protein